METNRLSRTMPLSPRQQEIYEALGRGETIKQIAAQLGISRKTVEAHVDGLKIRLGVHSIWALVVMAIEERIFTALGKCPSPKRP